MSSSQDAGNAAAMREALMLAIEVDDWCCAMTDDPLECCEYSCTYQVEPHGKAGADCPWKKIRAALAKPPRNCDRFMNADEALEALEKHWNSSGNGCIRCPVAGSSTEEVECKTAWLFAPSTERKGETDGSK